MTALVLTRQNTLNGNDEVIVTSDWTATAGAERLTHIIYGTGLTTIGLDITSLINLLEQGKPVVDLRQYVVTPVAASLKRW